MNYFSEEVADLSSDINNEPSKQPARKGLQIFSDAFEKAIGNVVFLRTMFSDNSVSLSFLLGKARGAPIKQKNGDTQPRTVGK